MEKPETKKETRSQHMKQLLRLFTAFCCLLTSYGATCLWCNPLYPPGSETVVPGSVVVTYYTNILVTSSFANGDVVCDANNNPTAAPVKTCSANGGSSTVKSWKVTGQISYSWFEVGGEVGEDVTYNADCGGTVSISSWCQCCKTFAGLLFERTAKTVKCTQTSGGTTCTANRSGQIDKFQYVLCSELPCTVSPTCKRSCPTGGG